MKKHILIAGSILVGVGIMNVIPAKNNEGKILKDNVIVSDVIENKKERTYYTSAVAKIDQDYTIKNTNSKEEVNNDINEDDFEIIYVKIILNHVIIYLGINHQKKTNSERNRKQCKIDCECVFYEVFYFLFL